MSSQFSNIPIDLGRARLVVDTDYSSLTGFRVARDLP
jgi:hypothetical protein